MYYAHFSSPSTTYLNPANFSRSSIESHSEDIFSGLCGWYCNTPGTEQNSLDAQDAHLNLGRRFGTARKADSQEENQSGGELIGRFFAEPTLYSGFGTTSPEFVQKKWPAGCRPLSLSADVFSL
ncbi:hypothetical protein EBR21_00620 [bacterium]|nr:hypothetical protein [bacterium]